MTNSRRPGKVYLVGAGPGDPGLLTLKGKECLEAADVVLYDYLANPVLLKYAPATAQRIYVGRRGRGQYQDQTDINRLLIECAKEGNVVVRLKGATHLSSDAVEKRRKRWLLQGSTSRLCLV